MKQLYYYLDIKNFIKRNIRINKWQTIILSVALVPGLVTNNFEPIFFTWLVAISVMTLMNSDFVSKFNKNELQRNSMLFAHDFWKEKFSKKYEAWEKAMIKEGYSTFLSWDTPNDITLTKERKKHLYTIKNFTYEDAGVDWEDGKFSLVATLWSSPMCKVDNESGYWSFDSLTKEIKRIRKIRRKYFMYSEGHFE